MTASADILAEYTWWSSLKQGGLLIAPSKLAEHFEKSLPELPYYRAESLRRAVLAVQDRSDPTPLLDVLFDGILGFDDAEWLKGPAVGTEWSRRSLTREIVKPRRLWKGPHGAVLPVFAAEKDVTRLGVGRGRRAIARVIEWLRHGDEKIALLTNGNQWRLIHAGADYDAWCEWDIDSWFEQGKPGPQVEAFRSLLAPQSLTPPKEGEHSRLVSAILASRKGQAELSSMLGERVRLAVEKLIQSCAGVTLLVDDGKAEPRDIYIAATRLVMRCVVILFAEARELLPRGNPIYEGSYGIQGLRALLDRLAGGHTDESEDGRSRLARLYHSHWAWPRLLALFRLVYHGSQHPNLTMMAYGGGLFEPGNADSTDPVLRALAAFEDPANCPTDAAVYQILRYITYSPVKVRQANRNTWVKAPVDFSDLSTEYIGILYEGLLDFELRRQDDTFLFLNIGDQPALPFSRLRGMSDKELADLFEKLKKSDKKLAESADDEESEDEDSEVEEDSEAEDTQDDEADTNDDSGDAPDDDEPADDDRRRQVQIDADEWARKAVMAAGLVKKPRSRKKDTLAAHEKEVRDTAKKLVSRTVMPGEWFLVRWGGTRKGSGTFYTRPQLAGPTVRRTLRPLAYEAVREETGPETGLTNVLEWRPKKPEEILRLKVCDPAMGSGSFLISALRFLTEALVESLHFHGHIERKADGSICRLADGLPADSPDNENLPVPPDHDEFDDRLRARLQRHVVERCIYGVDLDPLAVELARLALWITTMDRRLPFGFLDHKLKRGNSLVGCWFDRFLDYPAMAWEREGGDSNHERFVHHSHEVEVSRGKKKGQLVRRGDVWTHRIKVFRDEVIKPELRQWIEVQTTGREGSQELLLFQKEGFTATGLHDRALNAFERMHALPVTESEERKRVYEEEIVRNEEFQRLKVAFDTWCAVWFWPGNSLESAPRPSNFLNPPPETRHLVDEIANRESFFHWEMEFPDVFKSPQSGFDAVIGNPPWEIQKPNSREFFSNHDPLYRTYGKQYPSGQPMGVAGWRQVGEEGVA